MRSNFSFLSTAAGALVRVAGASATAIAAAALALGTAQAQESGSMQVGNATVSIGAGPALLTLPDIEFMRNARFSGGNFIITGAVEDEKDFGDEIGWNAGGSIAAPVGAGRSVSLNGFWAQIDDEDSANCTVTGVAGACAVFDAPGNTILSATTAAGTLYSTSTDRDVNHWGASLEFRQQLTPGVMGVTRAPNQRYWAAAIDVRGIDQDINLNLTNSNGLTATYNEDLDTRYYGGYLAWGGDYSPFLLGGLWQRMGLQSSFTLRGGIYYADADYSGRLVSNAPSSTRLSLSEDDVAFIGGLVLETRKRIGQRTTLSLKSEYEYYSWVPEMRYIDNVPGTTVGRNSATTIGDDDAFSARTMLRLTIGLGPRDLYEPSPYK